MSVRGTTKSFIFECTPSVLEWRARLLQLSGLLQAHDGLHERRVAPQHGGGHKKGERGDGGSTRGGKGSIETCAAILGSLQAHSGKEVRAAANAIQ